LEKRKTKNESEDDDIRIDGRNERIE